MQAMGSWYGLNLECLRAHTSNPNFNKRRTNGQEPKLGAHTCNLKVLAVRRLSLWGDPVNVATEARALLVLRASAPVGRTHITSFGCSEECA